MRWTSYLITSLVHQQVSQSWQFDIWSALIGAVLAFLLVGLAYAFRATLRQVWEAIAGLAARLMDYLRVSAEEEYRRLTAAWARAFAAPASAASLEALFIEPRLLAPPIVPESVSQIDPSGAGPRVLPLSRVLGAYPRLLILGGPGTGKTTIMAYLSLVCATAAFREDARVKSESVPESIRKHIPLYVSLTALDWEEPQQEGEALQEQEEAPEALEGEADQVKEDETQEEGEKVQEGEPKAKGVDTLLNAAASAVGGGGALTKPLQQYLEAGRAIIMVDGWDELSSYQRQQAAVWLAELMETLPENLWLVSVGMRDYAALTEMGFIPLVLASWGADQVEAFARRWVDAGMPAEGFPPVLFQELVAGLQHAARGGAPPLDLALRVFLSLSGQKAPPGRAALFDQVLDLLMQSQAQGEEPWWLAACRAALGQVALELQQAGRVAATHDEISAAIEAALPPPGERSARAAARVFQALTGDRGLMRQVGTDRYTFVHSSWRSYLAARQLVAVDPASLIDRLEDLRWLDVLTFYAELGDMAPLVSAWLRTPDDLFCTRLRVLCGWVALAPPGSAWRSGTMAILARAFLQPGIPASIRQALAEALAAVDMPGVVYFFKQALQRPESDVRVAVLRGLGRAADDSDLPVFEMAFRDQDDFVREAAVLALAYAETDVAQRRLEQMLLEGEDELRAVAAVALVRRGREGVDFVREAIASEDVMTRRAVVFGLAEAGDRDLLSKIAREDEQWIVRTAASTSLEELGEPDEAAGISPVPQLDQLPWLISWAASLGEGVGVGEAARRMLLRALEEGDLPIRLAVLQVLNQVGRPDDLDPLRAALADPDPAIANAALEALVEIGRRYDLTISRAAKAA